MSLPRRSSLLESGFSDPGRRDDGRDRTIEQAVAAVRAYPLLASFVADLATRKKWEAALLTFEFWWFELGRQERAAVVRSYRPGASEAEVARWSGVGERTLHRWPKYKRIRDRARDAARRRREVEGFRDRDGDFDAWGRPDG